MKTTRLLNSWLRCAAVMLFVFAGGLSSVAQEVEGGEAFYIYQNDGHFDGFFYDQVKQISYSRLDTLGVEHDRYVSQEIVTADSVYRIMLTAIDSVSFVQPEIKYAQGLRFMRNEGMMDYFLSAAKNGEDEIIVTFRSTMPASLRPKAGEVLQCPNLEGWEEGTLVAKVKSVSESGSNLIFTCGYVSDLKDVFEQFITVEQVTNTQSPQGSKVRRRIAGINAPTRAEANLSDLTLFNFSNTFEGTLTLYDKLKLQLVLNTGFGMTLSAAYKITLSEFYVKTIIKSQMSLGGSFGLDGELYAKADLKALPGIGDFVAQFAKIPFPANFPILFVDMLPMPFARAEAHLNIGFALGAQVKATSFMLEIKDKYPYIDMGLNFIAPFLPYSVDPLEKSFSLNAQINGSVQTGLQFPLKVNTLPWMKKLAYAETGATLYAGPKISGALNFDILKAGEGVYESLKDSKVELSLMSIDSEFEGNGIAFGKEWSTKRTSSWTYGNLAYTIFPEFDNLTFNLVGDKQDEIQCRCEVSGQTCLPQKVGIGVYSKANDNDKDFTNLYDSFYMPDIYWLDSNINGIEGGFTKMEPGEYRLRPIISLAPLEGYESLIVPVYDKEKEVVIEQMGLGIEPEEYTFEEEGGNLTVKLITKQAAKVVATPNADWIKVDVTQPVPANGGGSMKVTVEPNEEDRFRQGAINLVLGDGKGEGEQKTFTVKQYGGLQLSVSKLDFETDGGSGKVEILTSMKPINIDLQGADDWVSYSLDDRTLTVRTGQNKGAQRTAVIIVSAWSAKYNGINTVKLTITQKGLVDAVVEPSLLTFEAVGGTQRVNVSLGANTTFNEVIVSKKDQEWIIVEKKDNYFNVTVLPNTETKERECIVDCSVSTTKDGSPTTVLLPVTITQKFGNATVSPSEVHFTAEGGSQDVKVDVSTYPYCGAYVESDGKGWADVAVSTNGVVTITTQPNAGTTQRECTVQCYVSGVKDPSSDQIIKLPVKVVQAGKSFVPVTPDGDKSPFKYINFMSSRYVDYISTNDGRKDTILQVMPSFSFTPKNSHFTVSYGKDVNHYECVGYQEWSANETKARCTLSFDIEKKTSKVKNLRFTSDSESHMSISMFGATANITNNASMVVQPNDFKLNDNGSTYKYGKLTAADGLTFGNFSAVADTRATYTISEAGKEFYGEGGIDPVSDHITYYPNGDSRDYVELTVAYNAGQGEPVDMDWPTDEVMSELRSAGMPINEGSAPPTVEGTYSLSAPTLVADKIGGSEELASIDNIVLSFSGQKGGEINFDAYFVVSGQATGAAGSQKALISGSGQKFSICIPDKDGGAVILSGELSDGAINNLYYSSTSMTEKGKYIIFKDGTGTSRKTAWSPGSNDF